MSKCDVCGYESSNDFAMAHHSCSLVSLAKPPASDVGPFTGVDTGERYNVSASGKFEPASEAERARDAFAKEFREQRDLLISIDQAKEEGAKAGWAAALAWARKNGLR